MVLSNTVDWDRVKTIIEWLSEQRQKGKGRISWSDFTEKVVDVTGASSYQQVDDTDFQFNLVGVTVLMEDGEQMYPIEDLTQGITRGYSTD